jgi:hypothetical protein
MVTQTRGYLCLRVWWVWECVGPTCEDLSSSLSGRIGVRGAIHQALLKRGIDPIPRDPWYYPTARQYEIVSS